MVAFSVRPRRGSGFRQPGGERGLGFWWQDGNMAMGPLKSEALREYKQRAKKRIQLIRALWQLAETCGEEAVEKALEAFKSAVEEVKS